MPTIPIFPAAPTRTLVSNGTSLPHILRTPSGLAIVEIQGTVKFSTLSASSAELEDSHATASAVGKLVFPGYNATKEAEDANWHKRTVHLYVGQHQRLTGEVRKLAKPIAVLRRREQADEREALEIAEVIHYKLLFEHRPEPVGGSAE